MRMPYGVDLLVSETTYVDIIVAFQWYGMKYVKMLAIVYSVSVSQKNLPALRPVVF